MYMRRDFDLNSVDMCTDSAHMYTESLKEVFRKTMLNQEIIFQKQVHELHRLYGMQKSLMQNISCMKFDQYNLNNLGLAHSGSQELSEKHRGLFFKLQQRPRGHELPFNICPSHVDPNDLKLSLSIRDDNRRKQRGKRTWLDEKFAQNVIDLEESTETIMNEDSGYAPPLSSASVVNCGSRHECSQKSVLTADPIVPSTPEKDSSRGTLKKSSFLDDRERNSSDQDLKRCDGNVLDINLSPKRQQISSCVTWNVDLNEVYCDGSSCYPDEPMVVHPSTGSSSLAFHGLLGRVDKTTWTKESNNCSAETSGIVHPLVNSNSNYESKEICRAKLPKFNEISGSEVVLALEAVSRQPKAGTFEDFGCHKNGPNDRNVGYTLESSNSQIHTFAATRDVSHEKRKSENDVISYSDHSKNEVQNEHGHGNLSSASSKTCHIADNESSNAETRHKSEADSGNPLAVDLFSRNQRGPQTHETLSGDLRSCNSSEVNGELLRKEESNKIDDLVVKAAESLINISLDSSACFQDCSVKDGGSTEMENREIETPEYSVDSFELLTLKLKDCNEDDLCVSSKPPEVDFAENKDYGFKIRRGRRLKDFQRDILPGLASLSRHEIREDINILEGVLRSREYRKMQAKMADRNNWCVPARSRRSRLNYVARRRFS